MITKMNLVGLMLFAVMCSVSVSNNVANAEEVKPYAIIVNGEITNRGTTKVYLTNPKNLWYPCIYGSLYRSNKHQGITLLRYSDGTIISCQIIKVNNSTVAPPSSKATELTVQDMVTVD